MDHNFRLVILSRFKGTNVIFREVVKVSEKLQKAVNGKCPKIKPGTLERVKLKTEVLLKDHLTVIKKPKIESIEDTEETELEDEAEEENQSAGLLIRPKSYIFSIG